MLYSSLLQARTPKYGVMQLQYIMPSTPAFPGLAVTANPVNGCFFCFSAKSKHVDGGLSSYDFAQPIVADILCKCDQ